MTSREAVVYSGKTLKDLEVLLEFFSQAAHVQAQIIGAYLHQKDFEGDAVYFSWLSSQSWLLVMGEQFTLVERTRRQQALAQRIPGIKVLTASEVARS